MINAWSLAYDVLNGTLDENFPIKKDKMTDDIKIDTSDEGVVNVPKGLEYHDPTHYVDEQGDIHLATSKDDLKVDTSDEGVVNIPSDVNLDAYEHSDAWYDYTRNDPDRENPFTDPKDRARAERVVSGGNTAATSAEELIISIPPEFQYSEAVDHLVDEMPSAFTTLADNDDQIAHHFADRLTLNIEDPIQEIMSDSRNKYHENEILKDVEEYVSRTYNGHYTGTKHEYRNVQTIDLMASRDLASDFCQANILKYGSRYGSKDGRNKKDLLKVIHYAMLLLHFDEHYGKPSMTSGNIDHNMP